MNTKRKEHGGNTEGYHLAMKTTAQNKPLKVILDHSVAFPTFNRSVSLKVATKSILQTTSSLTQRQFSPEGS